MCLLRVVDDGVEKTMLKKLNDYSSKKRNEEEAKRLVVCIWWRKTCWDVSMLLVLFDLLPKLWRSQEFFFTKGAELSWIKFLSIQIS